MIKIKLNKIIILRFKEIINHKLPLQIEFNRNRDLITYKSYIGWQLAQINQLDSLENAQNIVNIFNQLNQDISAQLSGSGWLEFTISDYLLCDWLKKSPSIRFPQLSSEKIQQNSCFNLSFNLYYTHARFCSILKFAHQQEIISLNSLQFKLNQWHIENYEQLPYYALPFKKESYEYKLIKELVKITEFINDTHHVENFLNILIKLSKIMLEFESYCRIWGKVKEKNIDLSQARLGLMALALHYYQNLFYAQFEIKLPTEL